MLFCIQIFEAIISYFSILNLITLTNKTSNMTARSTSIKMVEGENNVLVEKKNASIANADPQLTIKTI